MNGIRSASPIVARRMNIASMPQPCMGMLVRGADAGLLEDALLRFERDAMGLEGNVARARRIADWLTLLTRWEPS